MESTDPPASLRHTASAIARALIPVAGILFLHWSSTDTLIVYFADTLAAFFAVSVLAAGRLSPVEEKSGPAWYQRLSRGMQLAASGAGVTLIVGLVPFGFLLFMLLIQDFDWWGALHDRDLWIGVGLQFCGAVTLLLREYHHIEAGADADRLIKARFGLVFMRWVIVCGVFFFAVEVLQPQRGGVLATIFGFVLVLAYSIATIMMELRPQRLLAAFAPDLVARGPASSLPTGKTAAKRSEKR
jgi:hypothetical protein